MASNTKMCFFCKNSGENEKTYTSHTKHTCQKLANIECLKCGAKGHTESYCDDSGRKYATPQTKKPSANDDTWQEVSGGAKKAPLVFRVTNTGVVADERPVTPPPPPKNDEDTFPTLVVTSKPTAAEPSKPTVAKTLNFAALKFEQPVVKNEQQQTTVVTSSVTDEEFPALPSPPQRRSSPPARPPPMPTIQESDVANMSSDEIVDTINSNISATEIAERTAQQLTSVVATLSTSLQLMNTRYEAKCREYEALLQAYNALVQQQQWGQRGSSWADEPMN